MLSDCLQQIYSIEKERYCQIESVLIRLFGFCLIIGENKAMKKVLFSIAIVLIIVIAGYVFGKTKWSAKHPQTLQKVTLAQAFETFLYVPIYVADAKGFYREEGLDVSIVTAGGDDKAFAALISDDAQFSVGDPTFAAVSGEKGRPGEVVGLVLNGAPFWGVAKADISTVGNPAELDSHKVATFPAPSTAYTLQKKMFESGGLTPNIREAAFGTLLPVLERGDVDIALELEPNVSTAVRAGNHVVYSLSQYYPDFALTGIVALPEYTDKNPETIQKLVNAIQKADTFIRHNPEEAGRILSQKFSGVSEGVAIEALKNIIEANVIPADMMVSENGWNIATQLRKDAGDLKGDAPFATYVTNEFAQKAR